jgi:hypothetical protein
MSMKRSGLGKTLALIGVLALVIPLLFVMAAPVSAAGTIRVDGDAAGCVSTSSQAEPYNVVYCKIQDAVTDASAGDTIHVYPRAGVYGEGVDLSQMEPDGDITLITVNASGKPTPGTVTVDNPNPEPEIHTGTSGFNGDVIIDGFVLRSAYSAINVWVSGSTAAPAGSDVGPALTGDVVIRNVDASNTGGDGIAARADGNVTITNCTTNSNNGTGIQVHSTLGDVTIAGCTSNANSLTTAREYGGAPTCGAAGICVTGTGGKVKISDCTTNSNGDDGIRVEASLTGEATAASIVTLDQVTIERCTAKQNGDDGIDVRVFHGLTVTDCTTNGNGEDGIRVGGGAFRAEPGVGPIIDGGDVTIKNCTSNGNGESGFGAGATPGTLSIQACIASNNESGVSLGLGATEGAILVNGSIICQNECGLEFASLGEAGDAERFSNDVPSVVNAEGNWWGCTGGPEADGCNPICPDSIPVDYTPWIKKISASATVDPATVGQPTEVSFQFSGNPSAVYLGEGPGDRRGPAPFTVNTDNGTLNGNGATVGAFVGANGTLKVTLVPQREGTATVAVAGPCGLEELEGATAVLGVGAEFVPEPGTVLLLGTGLMGLAGYAGLRLRKR